jgi:hypothetical protein
MAGEYELINIFLVGNDENDFAILLMLTKIMYVINLPAFCLNDDLP